MSYCTSCARVSATKCIKCIDMTIKRNNDFEVEIEFFAESEELELDGDYIIDSVGFIVDNLMLTFFDNKMLIKATWEQTAKLRLGLYKYEIVKMYQNSRTSIIHGTINII